MEQVRLRSNRTPASPEQILQWRRLVVEQKVERLDFCTLLFGKALLGSGLHLRFEGKRMDGMKAFALINFTEIPQHCVVIIGSYPAGLAGRGEKVSERDGLGHGWHEYISF